MRHVLVVDDDPNARETLSAALGLQGDVVKEAKDGTEAVALARTMTFDIVVSDVQMEPLDGIGAAQQIRAFDQSLPIVFVTGHPSPDLLKRALSVGAYTVAPKTLPPAGFLRLVDRAASQPVALVVGSSGESSAVMRLLEVQRVEARFATVAEAVEIMLSGQRIDVCVLATARPAPDLRREIEARAIPAIDAPLGEALTASDASALLERIGRARLRHAKP